MDTDLIFISHATKDDEFVKELRLALEGQGLSVWVDSRNLRGGDKLAPGINQAIEQARQVIVVLSTNTINSPWVRKEIQKAQEVERQRKDDGYRVIPLLLPGVEPTALALWFDEEPVAVPIQLKPGGLSEALPSILAALGERLSTDRQPMQEVESQPVEELILELIDPEILTDEGKRRATATAKLVYHSANPDVRGVESRRFDFTAPLGPIETGDVRWYLESYFLWPTGVFQERAERIEAQLPQWGKDLYEAALKSESARAALTAWQNVADDAERRFSVQVDRDAPEGANEEQQADANEAACDLLSLPWELLHDDSGYLFQGKHAARVRRRLPNRRPQSLAVSDLPIRILLVSPRPEDEHTSFIDHRSSALPLVEAVESLGELVELTVLTPPTFPALQQALKRAADEKKPFDVVHFDGHGIFDREHGLGGLCFEAPQDTQKLQKRAMALVHAEELASVMRAHRIPLVFLDACQTAKTEEDPTASVAARLLEEGVTSVVAMSHSVLVETARRFVKAFYEELAQGARVGKAMLAGQQKLKGDTYRGKIMGAGELHLQDWFVPVLYQEEVDRQLFTVLLPQAVRQLQAKQRRLNLGKLPKPPKHTFIGRSRELLTLERLLHEQPYAVVRGQGGAGKTALAVELARWLVRTERYRRAAFVCMEHYTDVRAVLDNLGHQLLPEGENWSVAQFPDLKQAFQPVERALFDQPTIIVVDNLESVLPDSTGQTPAAAAPVDELFALCQDLLNVAPTTRLLFTSREPLPEPFDHRGREVVLGALSREDAIELVSQVMAQEGLTPVPVDPGGTSQEIIDLVEAAHCHARALVLLAREVSRRGVRTTTENLHQLMSYLHQKYPDDREKSLYASVELSLRRLSPEAQERIKGLGVFHGGAEIRLLAHVLDVDADAARNLAIELIEVGLGEDMGYGHLRFDPALPPYLLGKMDEEEGEQLRARWAEGMMQLTNFLYEQLSQDAQLSAQLTLLELPNLLALLDWIQDKATPEGVVGLAGKMESLLEYLGRPQAFAQMISVRERATQALGEWSHARYSAEIRSIDRLLDSTNLQSAYTAAQQLQQRCLSEGEDAYQGANYDIAYAHWELGRVLKNIGAAEAALQPLAEAQERFQVLADAGNTSAEGMGSAAITESGDCLRNLGRLDEAVAVYEEAIKRDEKLDRARDVAVGKGQLGTVRMLQERYADALEIYEEARDIFKNLGEPNSVATIWHQIGMVHKRARQFEQAEQAYRQSLAIYVQQKDRAHEAGSLGELGNLYDAMERLEEATTFYRQATDIYVELQDLINEGRARNNLANTLLKLQRYDEARRELHRAIDCKKPYGHAATPWTTWNILHDLEQATGNPQAAVQARQRAIQSYLAYRRAGGESQTLGGQLCAVVAQAIQQEDMTEAEQILAQMLEADVDARLKVMIPKLQAILNGARDPALAAEPELYYDDAVELQLLLESLRA